ncbi:DUF6346 domain-containing protein [Saccharopolyspora sp. CA-218241]|uniref:DUF6346 domain-containing protein n=1 Tax=Saccharopolyspora sp. CA-218241 TaxID=3240027 RepID=UPI003D962078
MLGGFVIVALLLMLWPTIVFTFPLEKDNPNGTATAHSCEDTGPVTRRGFGINWNCVATIRDHESGETWTAEIDMNFFTPEDIGEPKEIVWGYGGSRSSHNTELRTYTLAEGGVSSGARTAIAIGAAVLVVVPAIFMFIRSLRWSGTQEQQRKDRERVNGTPEEQAAKKKEDEEFWAQMRRNREQRKQARRQRKQTRS